MNKRLKRIYHPIDLWEEVAFNMWGSSDDPKQDLQEAIEFTSDHVLYGSFMQLVTLEWQFSCENALTDYTINRKAWLGHAAVAMAKSIPENITRKAWGFLTHEQQLLANKEAAKYIRIWENRHIKVLGVCENMGSPLLL